MEYWDVLVKSILPLVVSSEDVIFIFTVYKNGHLKYYGLTFLY